ANLRFCARLFGVANPPGRVDAMIDRLDLAGWSHRPVRALSRGLVQRCALARVLLHDPDLLLLDEPFTGLDLDARELLGDVLHEATRAGVTLLMSTHDVALGLMACSRARVLVRGRTAWQGPIDSADTAAFEAHYRSITHRRDAAASGIPPTPFP